MAPDPAERKLAAIMFTDIVGYTALMAESEEKGLRVRARHRALLRPLVEKYHGELIEARGDESLSVFPTALDAVNCALVIEEQTRGEPDLKLHIGIHLGDVVVREGEVSGDGVNIAARICALSTDGGLCVSGEVYRSIRNQPGIHAEARGEQKLRNVPEPVAVYSVEGSAGAPSRTSMRESTLGWIRSLAVLPLENLSGDPEQEYFADGMTEALIGDLAKIGSLSVISRTSVMRYKNSDKSLPEIAQELNVAGVVEGTVMRAGDRVRITAQLIDARNDRHLWSDRYDRELSDVLALQSDVARAVAEQVRLELSPEERAALTEPRSVDPRAYDTYLRGIQVRGPTTLVAAWGPRAISHFERAVELDPEFAEGYAALAHARFLLGLGFFNLGHRGEFPRAREAAQRALELDAHLGRAHAYLGSVRLWYDWDFSGARRAFERALQLGPNDPETLNAYAVYLTWAEGKTQEALAFSECAFRVAPFDLFYRADRVRLLFVGRQYERALEEVERAREFALDFVDFVIANTYFMLGRLEEEHRERTQYFRQCGAACDWALEARERGWVEGGWEGSVRAWLEAATQREAHAPSLIAVHYTMINEREEAFAWLERAYRERDPQLIGLKFLPMFDALRSDPRFDDLLRRIGFPES
jgi:TolB-like protein